MRKLCLISDYLGWLMTGEHVTEAGASALTALVDIRERRWWPEMLGRLEIDDRSLPAVLHAGSDLGRIRPESAEKFGLPPTCRFILGCLDQYAGAIGCGNVLPGLISETTGTVLAAVAFAESRGEDLGPSVFQGPAFASNSYYRMAFGEVSANYLESYRNSLCDRPDFASLAALAEEVAPGADGLRLNTNDPPPRAADLFTGRTPPHSRGQAVRSIFEAVAVALRGQVHWLGQQASLVEIRSAGGGAERPLAPDQGRRAGGLLSGQPMPGADQPRGRDPCRGHAKRGRSAADRGAMGTFGRSVSSRPGEPPSLPGPLPHHRAAAVTVRRPPGTGSFVGPFDCRATLNASRPKNVPVPLRPNRSGRRGLAHFSARLIVALR